jgi:predicted phosphodiesterase
VDHSAPDWRTGRHRPTSSTLRSPLVRLPTQPNDQTTVLGASNARILCIADIRGRLSALNELAREHNASAIIHTGDFGFFDEQSLERVNDRTLRHLTMYSPLIPSAQRSHLLAPENPPASIRSTVTISMLSEFPLLLSGQIKLQVPVYTVWGACEDVVIVEKFRSATYSIPNLNILDEATTRCLDVAGVKLRLLGLGGALVPHKMFDNGEGHATIAGGQGTMWTTALQIGELVDTAQRVFDQAETRVLITHTSPGREGLMAQLGLVVKADLTISAGLHFRYASSYNEFSVQGDFDGFRQKLVTGKDGFDKVWESVKEQVDAVIDENQKVLLDKALSVVARLPPSNQAGSGGLTPGEEPAWKNCWNWNLCDAAYGSLVLDVREGRISSELKSQGFNFAYRRNSPANVHGTPGATNSGLPGPEVLARPTSPLTSEARSLVSKTSNRKERSERDPVSEDTSTESTDGPASKAVPSTLQSPQPHDSPRSNQPQASTEDTRSPIADSSSGGNRTPTRPKPQRNPWTLFMRMTISANEAELREYYGEAASGITRISYPSSFAGRNQKIAYVEFGDEDAMRAGLENRAAKLKETIPDVVQATDRETRQAESQGRGRGRGRGSFVARGFAAAGLTHKSKNHPIEASASNSGSTA